MQLCTCEWGCLGAPQALSLELWVAVWHGVTLLLLRQPGWGSENVENKFRSQRLEGKAQPMRKRQPETGPFKLLCRHFPDVLRPLSLRPIPLCGRCTLLATFLLWPQREEKAEEEGQEW